MSANSFNQVSFPVNGVPQGNQAPSVSADYSQTHGISASTPSFSAAGYGGSVTAPAVYEGGSMNPHARPYGSAGMFSAYQAGEMSQSFNIRYDVQLVPQLTGFSCWAAGFAMIVGWSERMSINPSEIARAAGYWAQYQNGLHPEDVTVMNLWGFVPEAPQSYLIEAFVDLLRDFGPLWVASAEPGPHIRVVTGIYGDGTPDGTKLLINDPWDKGATSFSPNFTGSQYEETYREFVAKQSTLAGQEMNYAAPIYIAHLPQLPDWARNTLGNPSHAGQATAMGAYSQPMSYGNPVVIELGSEGWEARARQAASAGQSIKLTLHGPYVDQIYQEYTRQKARWDGMRNTIRDVVGFDDGGRRSSQAMMTGAEVGLTVIGLAALLVILALVGLAVYRDLVMEMMRRGYCGDAKIAGSGSGSGSGANDGSGSGSGNGVLEINLERCPD